MMAEQSTLRPEGVGRADASQLSDVLIDNQQDFENSQNTTNQFRE